ncbi:hypothetical protein, partial [Methanohalobium sp.]|uniref:DUF7305 domain-containing protein n=1 Tax=Methanohalobium sp. TaxID=2837493 RepID=UPI0025CF8D64
DISVRITQSGVFEGVIYAPSESNGRGPSNGKSCNRSTATVCIGSGSSSVTGAVISGSTDVSQGATLNYDSNISSTTFNEFPVTSTTPPKLTYIHVSTNRIDMNESKTQT